jgi:hypothetical protein
VNPGTVQCFVHVDIPHPGEERLVQQKRFQLSPSTQEHILEQVGRKRIVQGFGTEIPKHFLRVGCPINPSEFARIAETHLPAVVEVKDGVCIIIRFCTGGTQKKIPAHAKVNEQRPLVQWKQQIFCPTTDGLYCAVFYSTAERGNRWSVDMAWPGRLKAYYPSTGKRYRSFATAQ